MKELIIKKNEAGQRFDKLLKKYLKNAGSGFIYRMLRKKNIILNGKKAEGNELLKEGDSVRIFFSDETLQTFTGDPVSIAPSVHPAGAPHQREENRSEARVEDKRRPIALPKGFAKRIIYEDENLLVLNKPSGMLSQTDGRLFSANEYCLEYLLEKGELTAASLETFRPGIANRLDRNTSGILLFGKTLPALQELSTILKNRTIRKFYLTLVTGKPETSSVIQSWLSKDDKTNRVTVRDHYFPGSAEIRTEYQLLETKSLSGFACSLLEIHLITGKTHQIRAHLASIGCPVVGDPKYGDRNVNADFREKYGVTSQLLHAWRLEFPKNLSTLRNLSGKFILVPPDSPLLTVSEHSAPKILSSESPKQ